MLLDLISFGYDSCSQKSVRNIFQKAVDIGKPLNRVLLIALSSGYNSQQILKSVKYYRQEFNQNHSLSNFQEVSSKNYHVMEISWVNLREKMKIKRKYPKKITGKKYQQNFLRRKLT